MAASNLSSFSTARSSDAPPLTASPSRTTSTMAFVSQTPSSSSPSTTGPAAAIPPNTQPRPAKRKHSSDAPRVNQTSQSGVNAVSNQQGRANAEAGQRSSSQSKSSDSAVVQTFISALVLVLNMPEYIIKGCAHRLQREGKDVTKNALYDECMKYENHNWDFVSPNSSDFNSLTSDYQNSLPSMLSNDTLNTSTQFSSLPPNRSTTDFQPSQLLSSSVANTRSGKENTRSTPGNRYTGRSRFSNAGNANSAGETGVKQGFNRPTRDNHEGFSFDTGYSSLPNSSRGSSGLSVSAQQSATANVGEDVPDGCFRPCFGSTQKNSSASQTRNAGSSHSLKTSYAGSPNTSDTGGVTSNSASNSLSKNMAVQSNIGRQDKAPLGGRDSNAFLPQTSEDRPATNKGSASTSTTGAAQFSTERNARTLNWSSQAPSISPMSRSENNPDSGYGGEPISVLESEMGSLQISGSIADNGTAPEMNELPSETPANESQGMGRDGELSHALTLLKAVQKENALLTENSLCTGCHERPRRITHLPCGHFISCPQCADHFDFCQLCNARILATVDTYLA